MKTNSQVLEVNLPPFVKQIMEKFSRENLEIYIVGGAVRDILMERKVTDWDFTTNAPPEKILELFPDAFYDNKFGTVGIAHEPFSRPFEITTFRTEAGYADRRHPDTVSWGNSLEEDLARRDFTINAMSLKLESDKPPQFTIPSNSTGRQNSQFKLVDPFKGQKDLKSRLIKAVGNPVQRFDEDALRMMRAVRIATELGFEIENETFEAIKMHTKSINIVSKERIRDELFKLLASDYPYEGIMVLRNSGLMDEILPELEAAFKVDQKSPKRHHKYDVGTHCLFALKFCPSKDPLVRFATLIHDIGKPATHKITDEGIVTFYNHEVIGAKMAKEIAERFRFSKEQKDRLWRLVRWHQFSVDERQTDSAIRRFIKRVGKENLLDILDLRTGDRLGGASIKWFALALLIGAISGTYSSPFVAVPLLVTWHKIKDWRRKRGQKS